MSGSRRVEQHPAFLLHHRPFRDTSLLLDVFSRDHGKIALVARGARSQKSRLRGVLRPFLPLSLSWVLKSDLGTLTGAELDGGPLSLGGDSLLAGYYANELVLNFVHRHDAQPELFTAYGDAIRALAATSVPAPVLRAFELELLRLSGYELGFAADASTGAELEAGQTYDYRVELGAIPVAKTSGDTVFSGAELIGIREQRFDDPTVLRAAGRLLRHAIRHHLGGRELKSRKVLVDLVRGRDRITGS